MFYVSEMYEVVPTILANSGLAEMEENVSFWENHIDAYASEDLWVEDVRAKVTCCTDHFIRK